MSGSEMTVAFPPLGQLTLPAKLPKLVVLIGPNGSGKSMLLKQILSKGVEHNDLPTPAVLFSPSSMKPPSLRSGLTHQKNWQAVCERDWRWFEGARRRFSRVSENLEWTEEDVARFNAAWNNSNERVPLQFPGWLLQGDITKQEFVDWRVDVSRDFNELCIAVSASERFSDSTAAEAVFRALREGQTLEQLKRLAEPTPSPSRALPWNELNRLLHSAGLPLSVSSPLAGEMQIWDEEGRLVPTTGLSDGEQTLFWLASFLVPKPSGKPINDSAKTLLLDEPDASLHPALTHRFLNLLKARLALDDARCIVTSHAPSTVALAPDDSLYSLRRDKALVIMEKVTRTDAVARLTTGIPSLALSFENRRQVFVESERDAERFNLLYQLMRSSFSSELSLSFVGVGRKEKKGDDGSGCAKVLDLVDKLADAGNRSVFGLVDWDLGDNEANDRVLVLSQNRYAIENVLLDPLLLGALLLRESPGDATQLGFAKGATIQDAPKLESPALQLVVDSVLKTLGLLGPTLDVVYQGGFTLKVSREFLHFDPHELEDHIKTTFVGLKRFHKTGQLLLAMVDTVVRELPGFLPSDVVSCFEKLAGAQVAE